MSSKKFQSANRPDTPELTEYKPGTINLGVAADEQDQMVVVNFGQPVTWFAISRSAALEFAKLLVENANKLNEEQ